MPYADCYGSYDLHLICILLLKCACQIMFVWCRGVDTNVFFFFLLKTCTMIVTNPNKQGSYSKMNLSQHYAILTSYTTIPF